MLMRVEMPEYVEMIVSAEQARRKAMNNVSDAAKIQLLKAANCINAAIKRGEMLCYCRDYLGSKALDRLYGLGYKVENCSTELYDPCYLIKW